MNAGIYATIIEQFILALLVAILAVSTPGIVGAYVPGYGKWILAVVCFVAAAVQFMGFTGVFQEKATMFRRYTTLHILLTVAAFAISLTWIIISASNHNTAVSTCKKNFFTNDTSTGGDVSTAGEDQTLCNIFTWTDVGLMGGLWVVLAIMQFYLYTVISSYGTGQRMDHEKYRSIYSVTDIPMVANGGDPWDARPSVDGGARRGGGHSRSPSTGSVSTVMGEKMQDPNSYNDRPSTSSYPPPQRRLTRSSVGQNSIDDTRSMPSNPAMAYTQDPMPTPYGYENYEAQGYATDGVNRPGPTQAHPAEGSFGRKTPRLQKPDRRDY